MEASINLPQELYRGDSDKLGKRRLKLTIRHGQLQTNLINGGQGSDIIAYPLHDLIKKHVDIGWEYSHFLSFSSNSNTAFKYGAGERDQHIPDPFSHYTEWFEDEINYDFVFITFHTDMINWTENAAGLYEGRYIPSLNTFSRIARFYSIILIDVVKFLSVYHIDNSKALMKAKLDNEWLVLPNTPLDLNLKSENSAILDGACITYKKYLCS